jgi:hypothetical protein
MRIQLFITMLLSSVFAFAQSDSKNSYLKSVVQPASNVAGIGKFIDVPVSYNTGVPSINIPIANIEDGPAKINIALSYHAGGTKVHDIASWIGLGWSMSGGGFVNRAVKGRPDEFGAGYLTKGGLKGFPWILNGSNNANTNYQTNPAAPGLSVNWQIWDQFINSNFDGQPDIFSFVLPNGMSGKFVFDEDGIIRQIVKTDVQVELVYSMSVCNGVPNIGFVIITPDATRFYFGENCAVGSISANTTRGGSSYQIGNSDWQLTKIYFPNENKTVNYTYFSEIYNSLEIGSEQSTTLEPVPQYSSNNYIPLPLGFNLATNSNNVKRLQTIITENYTVSFNVNTRQDLDAARLDKIIIRRNSDNFIIRQIQLEQDYWQSSLADETGASSSNYWGIQDTKRLRLKKVQETNGDNTKLKPPYEITYNETITMPRRLSFAVDHWGYFNNQTSNRTMLPTVPHPAIGSSWLIGADKSINVNTMAVGIIKSIKDPLGGEINFEFEPHSVGNTIGFAGGLRIKTITTTDPITTKQMINSYEYNPGELVFDPRAYYTSNCNNEWQISQVNFSTGGFGWCGTNGSMFPKAIWSSTNLGPMQLAQGQSVIYTSVKEKYGPNGENGYKVITYKLPARNFSAPTSRLQKSQFINPINCLGININTILPQNLLYETGYQNNFYPVVPLEYDYTYNFLEEEKMYTSTNILKTKKQYIYSITKDETPWMRGFLADKVSAQTANDNYPVIPKYAFTFYKLNTGKDYLDKVVTTEYDDNNVPRTTEVNYKYESNEHLMPTRTITKNSKGEDIEEVTYYSKDYANSATPLGQIQKMKWTNLLIPLTKEVWKNNNLLSSAITTIGDLNGNNPSYTGKLQPFKVTALQTNVPLSSTTLGFSKAFTNQRSFLIPSLSQYKDVATFNYNPTTLKLEEQQKLKDVNTSYIWGYNNTYVIAQIVNASRNDVTYTSFENDAIDGFTVNTGGIVDPTAPTGKNVFNLSYGIIYPTTINTTKRYILSCFARAIPTVNNATLLTTGRTNNGWTLYTFKTNTGASTVSISGATQIDELRLYPENALMTTSTYEPLVGITSQCDANNKVIYYQYDGFQRLSTIKNQDGNIIKKICYRLTGQPEDCGLFNNIIISQYFTRNNCPSGENGSSVLFTVSAGMFSSATSQADVDLQALNYLNTNGQSYANDPSNGGTCTATLTCNVTTCSAQGAAFKCVNGNCEQGIKVSTDNGCNIIYINYPNDYEYDCWETYHYEFSDGTWSQDFTCWNNNNCQ